MTGPPIPVRRAAVLLAAAAVALSAAAIDAHTNARYYRGEIAVSTSWDGVIRLTGTVVIREGVIVTVDPGTEVLVQPGVGAEIVVKGRFLVRGTAGKPVVFETAGGCRAGPWGGIVFVPGSTGILEYARVRCASGAIRGDLANVTRSGVAVEPGPWSLR